MKNENQKAKTKMKLSDIKISSNFESHPPRWEKVAKCYDYYINTGKLGKPILVNNNVLVDGYVAYLVARMFNVKYVEVEEI